MTYSKSDQLRQIFHVVCILSAIILTCWCIHEFRKDSDVTEVEFKEFHKTTDDIYPSITFCLKKHLMFKDEKLANYNLTITEYKEFLRGKKQISGWLFNKKLWDSKLTNIDYDEVTLSIKDIMDTTNALTIRFLNNNDEIGDRTYWNMKNDQIVQTFGTLDEYKTIESINSYVSARQPNYKCFTFDIPIFLNKLIEQIVIYINGSLFQDGICWDCDEFFATLHYPGQFIRVPRGNRLSLKSLLKAPTSCYELETSVGSLEVLKRRDKTNQRCNTNWRTHDDQVLKDIIREVQCKPNHWKIESDLKNCTKYEEYRAADNAFNSMKESMPPCRSIEKLSKYTYEIDSQNKYGCLYSQLRLRFLVDKETLYKQLSLVQSYTVQSLVGNAGKK